MASSERRATNFVPPPRGAPVNGREFRLGRDAIGPSLQEGQAREEVPPAHARRRALSMARPSGPSCARHERVRGDRVRAVTSSRAVRAGPQGALRRRRPCGAPSVEVGGSPGAAGAPPGGWASGDPPGGGGARSDQPACRGRARRRARPRTGTGLGRRSPRAWSGAGRRLALPVELRPRPARRTPRAEREYRAEPLPTASE